MPETTDNNIRSSAHRAPRLGIIGGGQLARMTAVAALQLGCDVIVLERNDHSPASAQVATRCLVGDWNNPDSLIKLATQVDVVSIENEFVNLRCARSDGEKRASPFSEHGLFAARAG